MTTTPSFELRPEFQHGPRPLSAHRIRRRPHRPALEGAVFTAAALDPNGTATNNDIGDAFQDGVLVVAEGRVTIKPRPGGPPAPGGGWSNKERISLVQDPPTSRRQLLTQQFPRLADPGPVLARFLERFFPGLLVPAQPLNRVNYTWTVYYNFDQYLWSPEGAPDRGSGSSSASAPPTV